MVPPAPSRRQHFRTLCVILPVLAIVSLGEARVFHRLVYSDPAESAFVVASVSGVLAGRPAFRAWQHRFLAPALVSVVDRAVHNPLRSVELFSAAAMLAANALLLVLLRRRGVSLGNACLAVASFGFCRFLLAYKLEYPWDGIVILLFLGLGYGAVTKRPLLWMTPLLLLGTFTHESVLYVPLWFLLAPLDRSLPKRAARTQLVAGAMVMVALTIGIAGLRAWFYRPSLDQPAQVAEPGTPLLGNPIHVSHNLTQLFVANFTTERAFISLVVLGALAGFFMLAARPRHRRAAILSIAVLAAVITFGYINETRLYLGLLAFWFAYGWPVPPHPPGRGPTDDHPSRQQPVSQAPT